MCRVIRFRPWMCLLEVALTVYPHLGGKMPQPPISEAWIGVFKPNAQNIKTFIVRQYAIDSNQVLHRNNGHKCSSWVIQICLQLIQDGRRRPFWKRSNRYIFATAWSIVIKLASRCKLLPQTLRKVKKRIFETNMAGGRHLYNGNELIDFRAI